MTADTGVPLKDLKGAGVVVSIVTPFTSPVDGPGNDLQPWRMAVVCCQLNQVAAAPVAAHVPGVDPPVLGNDILHSRLGRLDSLRSIHGPTASMTSYSSNQVS